MGDEGTAHWEDDAAAAAAAVELEQLFDWTKFFKSRCVWLQFFCYAIIFYITAPSPRHIVILFLWLLLIPLSVLNVMGTHLLQGLAASRKNKAN